MATLTKRNAIARLFRVLASHGWRIVDTDVTAETILDGDSEWLMFEKEGERAGVLIVVDCEPYETIADYSCSLSDILDPFIDSLAESQ